MHTFTNMHVTILALHQYHHNIINTGQISDDKPSARVKVRAKARVRARDIARFRTRTTARPRLGLGPGK